jgi:hypothetical protein
MARWQDKTKETARKSENGDRGIYTKKPKGTEGICQPKHPKRGLKRTTERDLQGKGGLERLRVNFDWSPAYSARLVAACRMFATATLTDGLMATIETRIVRKLNKRSGCLFYLLFYCLARDCGETISGVGSSAWQPDLRRD